MREQQTQQLAYEKFWPSARIPTGTVGQLDVRSGLVWPSGDSRSPFATSSGYVVQS